MLALIIKLILLFCGLLLIPEEGASTLTVAALLAAVFCSAICQYLNSRRFTLICVFFYFVLGVVFRPFGLFAPLLCVDLMRQDWNMAVFLVLLPISAQFTARGAVNSVFLILFVILALFMQHVAAKLSLLETENKTIRDTGTELNRVLEEKNKDLSARQTDAINLARLRERNRIAREIHDNVGHTLARSLIQTGALQAINKDESLTEPLEQLRGTLSLAMDSIRSSVHDLRDEATDLYAAISQMLEPMGLEIHLDYDASKTVPGNVQVCLLSVLREALTNISKHSDADRVRVTVREHPAFYQLLIHDNGTKKISLRGSDTGMGLINMGERVRALNGQFSAAYQDGFRIFLTIPKHEDKHTN